MTKPTSPKRRTPIRPISDKMRAQKHLERQLKVSLFELQRGRCAACGKEYWLRNRALMDKHEIKPRSLGGDPLDPENCVLLCRKCHEREKAPSLRRHTKSEFPFS